MDRKKVSFVLLLLSVVLFGVFLTTSVNDVRIHDTSLYISERSSVHDVEYTPIVEYENLSERGQEIYRATLENDGRYWTPIGEGASDFEYSANTTVKNDTVSGSGFEGGRVPTIIIERPEDDAFLPPIDEPYEEKYDWMATSTQEPPIMSGKHNRKLGSISFAIITLISGVYVYTTRDKTRDKGSGTLGFSVIEDYLQSGKYRCENCEEEVVKDESYGEDIESFSKYCEECGHLTEFIDVQSDYWNEH